MRVSFSINELSHIIFYDMTNNLGRKREQGFHLNKTICTLFKKMKYHETSIGVNKFHFNHKQSMKQNIILCYETPK
jgi:hypothetical protein